ncbi:MAG: hypothetical protein L6Q92_04155 [Phycisphaerae bacterium]|nr:hypothetical protein [Phycisphaerae bacterium]
MSANDRRTHLPALTLALVAAGAAAQSPTPAATTQPAASAPTTTAPAPLRAVRPGTLTIFETNGFHGLETETDRRQLTGKLHAVCFEDDGQTRIVTVYRPNDPGVLLGCPVTFLRVGSDGLVRREPELNTTYAVTFLLDAIFSRSIARSDAAARDEYTQVTALEVAVPASLTVQTHPDPGDAGWMRTETLARFTDAVALPPGRGRLVAWDARFVVDTDGLLSLADVRYTAEIAAQGNMRIVVHANVARSTSRALSADERSGLAGDVKLLYDMAREWRMERGKSRRTLARLAASSPKSVFAPTLAYLGEHLEREIQRFGETTPPHYWRPEGAIDARLRKPSTTQPQAP